MSNENNSSRKLAAILFADIAGYTAMMQSDEGKAMNKLRHYQTVLKREVIRFKGEIIKNYGDGSLCLFSSVLDAVNCAKALQGVFRLEPVIPLRIGLHLGDVMYEENDIYGNDLNIASRIESMGISGSVLMSKQVQEKVKNQSNLKFTSLGSFQFKNVEEPMAVYALANEGLVVPIKDALTGKFEKKETQKETIDRKRWISLIAFLLLAFLFYYFIYQQNSIAPEEVSINEKSIAVLPFTDLSPNGDQEYFSIGMMEEILNHLVKIDGLQVTSRNSSMTYSGSDKKTTEIAGELGVATILEGSVRKAGDVLRISVQFIDGNSDKHIWSETYDGNLKNVFAMQSDIAQKVANQLRAQITPDVMERIEQIPTQNMEAYSLYLEANRFWNSDQIIPLLTTAISLDPEFADAHIAIAESKLMQVIFSRDTIPENLDLFLKEINNILDKGLELDPDNASAYTHKGAIDVWFNWDFERAKTYYEKALHLNPSSDYIAFTELLIAMGDFEEALKNSSLTINANQNSKWAWIQHSIIYYFLNEPQKSEDALNIAEIGDSKIAHDGNYLRILTFQGKYAEMLSNYETIPEDQLFPRAMGYAAISYYHTDQQAKTDNLLQILQSQSAVSPIGSPAFHVAMIYAQMNEFDLAFKWLEKAFNDREVEMYWLKVEPPFRPLHNDPRWKEMLDKVGFTQPTIG